MLHWCHRFFSGVSLSVSGVPLVSLWGVSSMESPAGIVLGWQ